MLFCIISVYGRRKSTRLTYSRRRCLEARVQVNSGHWEIISSFQGCMRPLDDGNVIYVVD
jgi:hypothetical protein